MLCAVCVRGVYVCYVLCVACACIVLCVVCLCIVYVLYMLRVWCGVCIWYVCACVCQGGVVSEV